MSLLKIALIISLTGIFILLIISNSLSPKLININEINENYLNKNVKIRGKIINEKSYDNFKILTVQDSTGKIQATLNSKNKINHNNQTLIIQGKITEYENQLQISINKIIFS